MVTGSCCWTSAGRPGDIPRACSCSRLAGGNPSRSTTRICAPQGASPSLSLAPTGGRTVSTMGTLGGGPYASKGLLGQPAQDRSARVQRHMPTGRAADHRAVPGQRTLLAGRVGLGVQGEPTQRAAEELSAHGAQPTTSSRRLNKPPTPKASGKTNAAIATAVRQPRSLAIMVDTA